MKRVFIGLENINPDSLVGAKKRQNKITEYRKMLLAWKDARVTTYAGYILGFPGDTVESIRHDIEIIKRELPVDMLEFFFLTPLPGSEDHQKLVRAGTPLDEAARIMAEHKYGSAIVVDRGKIVGVFTTVDALFALSRLLGDASKAA